MDNNNEIILTREELYERVWKVSMRELSTELGMSDVGLRKLCHRNGIPTPPQGYHLMKSGHHKEKLIEILPKRAEGQRIEFHFKKKPQTNDTTSSSEMQSEWEELVTSSPTQITNKDHQSIKREIKLIKDKLNLKKLDERGILQIPARNYPIRTSPPTLPKAIDTLIELFARLRVLGSSLPKFKTKDSGYSLTIDWRTYEFRFHIEEFTNRKAVPLNERPKRGYTLYQDKWKFIPTGRLTLEILGPGYGTMTMQDGKKLIIERIDDLAKRMFNRTYEQKIADKTRDIRMARAVEYLKQKEQLRCRDEFEALKQKRLLKESKKWQRVIELRSYIDTIAGTDTSNNQTFKTEQDKNEWLTWAREFTDSLDPIKQGTAGSPPPYPVPKEITGVPMYYLDFDDPEEADNQENKPFWMR